MDNVDIKAEAQKAKEKLTPSPETVSTASSTHPIMSEIGTPDKNDDTDMMAGIRGDLVRHRSSVNALQQTLGQARHC